MSDAEDTQPASTETDWTPSPPQALLIDALATPPFPTIKTACANLEINYQTARTWHMNPNFKRAVKEACDASLGEYRDQIKRAIHGLAGAAINAKQRNLTQQDSRQIAHLESSWVLERLLGKEPDRVEAHATTELIMQLLTTPQVVEVAAPPADVDEFETPRDQ